MHGATVKRLAVIAMLLLTLSRGASAQQAMPAAALPLAAREAAEALRQRANQAYRAQQHAEAARLYAELAALPGARSPAVAHYQAACAHALTGEIEAAFRHLAEAMASGFRHAGHMAADDDLATLRGDSRWPGVLEQAWENVRRYERMHADPDATPLVIDDVARFGTALEQARLAADSAGAVEALRRHYLELGSAGLIDFYFSRMQGAELLADVALRRYPAYFAGLPALHDSLVARAPAIRAAFNRLRELHPAAQFPPVYFVIGHLRSGGTVSDNGLLIGLEVFGVTGASDTREFPTTGVPIIHSFEEIPFVVAHELVHLQQPTTGPNTLLAAALREGGADFVAELMTGLRPSGQHHDWGDANEALVWRRFAREMHGSDTSEWIANNDTATDDWPAALAYYVGYRIAKAYHERSADALQAVRDLLTLHDPEAILQRSGYAERFDPAP